MKKIKKAQLGTTTPLDTLYTKKTKEGGTRVNKYVARHPDRSIEMGVEKKNPLWGTTKRASRSLETGMKYSDEEIKSSMNKKKSGGTVKKAQNGTTKKVTMAQRDSIKAANRARVDSTLTARAKNKGYATKEEYLKKEGVDVNKKEKYVGVSKENRAPTGDSDKESGIKRAIRKVCTTPHCIYTNEDKSGVKKKNGGRITSKKK